MARLGQARGAPALPPDRARAGQLLTVRMRTFLIYGFYTLGFLQ